MPPLISLGKFRKRSGFTLAELLISLMILGEIATFTIPKIIYSQQNAQYNAIGKEMVGMISGAYQQAQRDGIASSSMSINNLITYLNYVKMDTSTVIDDIPGYTTKTCGSANITCIRSHNGAIVWYDSTEIFNGTNTTNTVRFWVDPDSTVSSNKSQQFYLQYNGKITDAVNGNGLVSNKQTFASYSNAAWFSW